MKFSDDNFLETEHRQLDRGLALRKVVLACANVGVTLIAEFEKEFLGKACHLYLVRKDLSQSLPRQRSGFLGTGARWVLHHFFS